MDDTSVDLEPRSRNGLEGRDDWEDNDSSEAGDLFTIRVLHLDSRSEFALLQKIRGSEG